MTVTDATMGQRGSRIRVAILVALAVGIALAIGWGEPSHWGGARLAYLAGAVALVLIPQVRAAIVRRIDRVRERRATWGPALAAGAATLVALLVVSAYQGRELFPKLHDEQMYLVQTRMLAAGRLWMPPHPLGDFFDTYYVLQRPVYAAVYFPGTALLHLPWAWFDLPYWLMPVLVSAGVVTLLCRAIAEVIDPALAVLAAPMMLALPMFRSVATGVMSHTVLMLMTLGMLIAWLRWLKRPMMVWALLAGALAGWAAITRPLDAICYALPLVVIGAMAARRMSARTIAASLSSAVLGATPFIALQLVFDRGVTGSAMVSPYQRYFEVDQPGGGYGFQHIDSSVRPQTAVVQKVRYYDEFIAPALARHQPANTGSAFVRERAQILLSSTLSHPLLALLLPVGLLGLTDRRRWAMWLPLPFFVIAYAFNAIVLPHYPLMYAPAAIVSVLLGVIVIERAFPSQRSWTVPLLVMAIVGASLGSLPLLNPRVHDHWYTPVMSDADLKLRSLPPQEWAVVLFRYTPGTENDSVHEEPVYNYDAAWPDDERIVRAHDLGRRNGEIVSYYAQRQPGRVFWLYDRATLSIRRLGTAGELARTSTTPQASEVPR